MEQKIKILRNKLLEIIGSNVDNYSVCFKELGISSNTLLIRENKVYHAASTFKTAVMVEVFNQIANKKFKITDTIEVINKFKSIVDSSEYSIDGFNDSGNSTYKHIGKKLPISKLVFKMITESCNLTTNILIDFIGAKNITQTLKNNSIFGISVLRGVEDLKAFDQNLNNTVTAFGLFSLFEKLANKELVGESASDDMISILKCQKFNNLIPKYLPKDIIIAHKTGTISGIKHDGGIVYLKNGRSYVLVILSKNGSNDIEQEEIIANISKNIYEYMANY